MKSKKKVFRSILPLLTNHFLMYNAKVNHTDGFRASFAASFVFICCLGEFPLSKIANNHHKRTRRKI